MNIETRAKLLSARIVAYCKAQTLTLGGIAARLENGAVLCADVCEEIGLYCGDHSLTLGSLLAEVEGLFNAYVAHDRKYNAAVPGVSIEDMQRVRKTAVVDVKEIAIVPDMAASNRRMFLWLLAEGRRHQRAGCDISVTFHVRGVSCPEFQTVRLVAFA